MRFRHGSSRAYADAVTAARSLIEEATTIGDLDQVRETQELIDDLAHDLERRERERFLELPEVAAFLRVEG